MMTPQEVANHSFAKATLGGYNLTQVDEFLDALTEDYAALFKENTILKNKLKVVSTEVEELRAKEANVGKAILDARQQADVIIAAAKKEREELIGEAEQGAQGRIAELQQAIATEEYRLRMAQESTAAYVKKLAEFHELELDFLAGLGELVPPELTAQQPQEEDVSAAIEAAVAAQVQAEEAAANPEPAPEPKPAPRLVAVGPDDDVPPMPDDLTPLDADPDELELDQEATRRYTDLKFGKDYKIK